MLLIDIRLDISLPKTMFDHQHIFFPKVAQDEIVMGSSHLFTQLFNVFAPKVDPIGEGKYDLLMSDARALGSVRSTYSFEVS